MRLRTPVLCGAGVRSCEVRHRLRQRGGSLPEVVVRLWQWRTILPKSFQERWHRTHVRIGEYPIILGRSPLVGEWKEVPRVAP